jgi:hypothetical protein
MVVQETSLGARQERRVGLQIATHNERQRPISDYRDLKARTRVYLPTVQWEAELLRWLAHAARAAASGDDVLMERCLDRCIDLLRKDRDFRFAGCMRRH